MEERVVSSGYVKLLALKFTGSELCIVAEKNTKVQSDIDCFKEEYENIENVILFSIHMNREDNITFYNYKTVMKRVHTLDYFVDLITKNKWKIM